VIFCNHCLIKRPKQDYEATKAASYCMYCMVKTSPQHIAEARRTATANG